MAGPSPITAVPWIGRGRKVNVRYRFIRHVRTLLGDYGGRGCRTDEDIMVLAEQALASWNRLDPTNGLTVKQMLALPTKESGLFAYGAYCHARAEDEAKEGNDWWYFMEQVGHAQVDSRGARDANCYVNWTRWLLHKAGRG